MKRIIVWLLVLAVLTGCGGPKRMEPELDPVYDSRVYSLELPEAATYELAGNRKKIVAMPFFNNGENGGGNVSGGTAIYTLEAAGTAVTGRLIAELEEPCQLLGMDPAGCVWIAPRAAGNSIVRQLDPESGTGLTIDLGAPLWQGGVFGFAADDSCCYFLCNFLSPDQSRILIYDRQGEKLFDRELEEYCQGTLGYLPREAEWAEELEGREDDRLLSMLFPEGPNDSVMLTSARDGSVLLTLIRKSPIDAERYCILCSIGEDFSLTPRMYYEVAADGGSPYGLPMPSPEDRYSVLSPQKDALCGVDLEAGTLTPLAGWAHLETGPSWFTGWANSVAPGPDGTIWSLEWSDSEGRCVIRAVGPK